MALAVRGAELAVAFLPFWGRARLIPELYNRLEPAIIDDSSAANFHLAGAAEAGEAPRVLHVFIASGSMKGEMFLDTAPP